MLKQRHPTTTISTPSCRWPPRKRSARTSAGGSSPSSPTVRPRHREPARPAHGPPVTTVRDERPTDPRRWDIPDDRWERTDEPPVTRTDRLEQVPAAVHEDVVHEDVITERGFSPGQILVALAGLAALALGIVAVARTGLEAPLSDPVEPVLGFDHSALLGLVEIGAGAVMLLASLRAGARWLGGLVGLAAIVGGILVLGELDWTVDELGAEPDFGWVAIAIGAVALLGAAIPRVRRTRRVSTTHAATA